jgi:uncharacterized protein (TIGR01777 family)
VINILITGGSGLVGTRLAELLLQRGHRVSLLGRNKKEGDIKSFVWKVDQNYIEPDAFQGIDAIVHLAGAGIADKPWTNERKREILGSRTKSTRLLANVLKNTTHNIKAVIAASAIGYYGFENHLEVFVENSEPGKDFLADVTRRWEKETELIVELGLRVVTIRIGIVLSKRGGALEEIARPIKYFVGAPLGSGNQYVSWIHLDDLCHIFVKAIEDRTMTGPYNAVSPVPLTNRELTKAIAKTLHRPLLLPPIPSFVLKLILGEMADLVLNGSKVSGSRIIQSGYQFKYSDINLALQDLLVHD